MSDADSTPAGDMSAEALSLAGKLAQIARELRRFAKGDKVAGSAGYAFTSVDDMADVIRPLMAEHGIVMYPREVELVECQAFIRQRVNSAGEAYETVQWRTVVRVTWHVADASQVLTLQSIGEALDTSDKSANKAQTAARKYAMVGLFNISTGDDPDPDHHRPGDDGEQRTGRTAAGASGGPQRPNVAVQKLMRDKLRELLALGNDDTPDVIATWLSERYPALERAVWVTFIEAARSDAAAIEWPAPLDVEQTKALTRTFTERAAKLKA